MSVAENTTFCKRIEYSWKFSPGVNGCFAEVNLDVQFNAATSAFLFDSFSEVIKEKIIDSFVQRLESSNTTKIAVE